MKAMRLVCTIGGFLLWGVLGTAVHADSLGDWITRHLQAACAKDAFWGACVVDVNSGETLYASHADTPIIPASNMKLYTSAAALDTFGSDYRFATRLIGVGHLDNQGIWHGDLVVRGSGDPSFGNRFNGGDGTETFRAWAEQLKQMGITRITGNIIGDDDLMDEVMQHPGWPQDQLDYWYTAPVSALTLNDNCITVTVRPAARVGNPPVVVTDPPTYGFPVRVDATTEAGSSSQNLRIRRDPSNDTVSVSGRIGSKASPKSELVTVLNPTMYFVSALAGTLRAEGIEILGKPLDIDDTNKFELRRQSWQVLAEHQSEPLSRILEVINQNSQNLYAESLLKTFGAAWEGHGSWRTGPMALRRWVLNHGGGDQAFWCADGSGLARDNRVTARGTCTLLMYMARHKDAQVYRDSLARPGVGSLRRRYNNTSFSDSVWAKTGYINRVYALSGYLETAQGRLLAFSLIFNGNRSDHHPYTAMSQVLDRLYQVRRTAPERSSHELVAIQACETHAEGG